MKSFINFEKEVDLDESEKSDTPFEGPYKQSKGTITDKSGAKHTQLSNVRSLARNAIEKMKQKMRMAHLPPEVRAEKLARTGNEELVGRQKTLDVDKDGKIEKSDLKLLRAKKPIDEAPTGIKIYHKDKMKTYKSFAAQFDNRPTKKVMEEEEHEEELEEDMDEGTTTRDGAITIHKGTYGTSYQSNDDDDEDTPEKKVSTGKRGRPVGSKSGAKTKGSSTVKSYGGVAIHSLRLPNNNK